MAATLTYLTQRALSAYRFASVDHPLVLAFSDYQFAVAQRDGVTDAKRKLRAELNIERLVSSEMDKAA